MGGARKELTEFFFFRGPSAFHVSRFIVPYRKNLKRRPDFGFFTVGEQTRMGSDRMSAKNGVLRTVGRGGISVVGHRASR